MLVAACMKGKAESWWFQQVKEEGSANFAWADFKSRLLGQYNYVYKQLDFRQQIDSLRYKNADDYINRFKRLIMKLPKDKISEWETSYLFTRNLPPLLRQRVLVEKCENLEELCKSLRENERISSSLNRFGSGSTSGPLPYINFKKPSSFSNSGQSTSRFPFNN
ncbi:hypothetical protein MJO29_013771 [Puccinia striiformis f. sp. tritici]|nr:hypothetical protein MJO29_013771 [Puccinia striiformis f. sp. tritici]